MIAIVVPFQSASETCRKNYIIIMYIAGPGDSPLLIHFSIEVSILLLIVMADRRRKKKLTSQMKCSFYVHTYHNNAYFFTHNK